MWFGAFVVLINGEEKGVQDSDLRRVAVALRSLDLNEETLQRVDSVLVVHQQSREEWDEKWNLLLADYGRKINALERQGARSRLRTVLEQRKRLLEKRPSLLRDPTPLREVMANADFESFLEALEK